MDSRDFSNIPSISYKKNNKIIKNDYEPPLIYNLDLYPSPYLTGIFDNIIKKYKFQAIIETNRGCPFSCAFCCWSQGTKLGKKYRFFSLERVKKTIEWFGSNGIEFVFCADSNFGIHSRDETIAKYFIDTKKRYNNPQKVRMCYAKNNKNVYKISQILNNAGLGRSVDLSKQSNNQKTLISIGRSNISDAIYRNLIIKYKKTTTPICTELIIGLPNETYQSFINGIKDIIQNSIDVQIVIYFCSILPNTTLGDKSYQKKYGIKSIKIPFTADHYRVRRNIIQEYEEIIMGTNSMNCNNWKYTVIFSWLFQMMYSLKCCYFILLYLQFVLNQNPIEFINYLISNSQHGFLNKIFQIMQNKSNSILNGGPRNEIIEDVYFPIEEVLYLFISENKMPFYDNIHKVILSYLKDSNISYNHEILNEVIKYQYLCMPNYEEDYSSLLLQYNLPIFFNNIQRYKKPNIRKQSCLVRVHQEKYNKIDFCYKYLIRRKNNNLLNEIFFNK